ncbi:hypothetical protein ACWD25_48370, partial [Streptomyces sp. NPDC002920]
MNDFLFWACVIGPALLAEALLARYEVLAYGAGWRAPATELPEGVPYARGAAPDSPPAAYLVYLDATSAVLVWACLATLASASWTMRK